MQTAISAHVCTPGRVPILGELAVGCDRGDSDAIKINMVHASGHVDVLKPGDNGRRWWVVGAEAAPHNWPGQHSRMLPAIPRTHDASADYHDKAHLSDSYQYLTRDGQCVAMAHRHSGDLASKWGCSLSIHDITGAKWWREFQAVTDDFGWLVEVPAC